MLAMHSWIRRPIDGGDPLHRMVARHLARVPYDGRLRAYLSQLRSPMFDGTPHWPERLRREQRHGPGHVDVAEVFLWSAARYCALLESAMPDLWGPRGGGDELVSASLAWAMLLARRVAALADLLSLNWMGTM
jgi:hypothetical protein